MTRCTFVHAADLHLDAPFRGLGALVPCPGSERLTAILRQSSFTALTRLVDLCLQEKADFLLLAGDVYNSAQSSLRARLALRDAFIRLGQAGTDVFLVHGNHDPWQGEDAAIPWPPNVAVFGPEPETAQAFARGLGSDRQPVALVSGVSHASPAESRNLARLLPLANQSPPPSGLFRIGLLHCSLGAFSGGHEKYAPCGLNDLREAGLDYWALGHVHAPHLVDAEGKVLSGPSPTTPLAAYAGSVQGLHVNETGPHGCLLARVDDRGRAAVEHIPLAPVVWEQVRLEPGHDVEDIPALEEAIVEHLGRIAPQPLPDETPGFAPQAVAARLILAGRSSLYHALRAPGALESLHARLDAELAGSGVFLRDLACELRPLLDRDALMRRPDLAGEALRTAKALAADPAALEFFARPALDELFARPKARKALTFPDPEELAALLDEAALLCLDLLGPETDPDQSPDPPEIRPARGGRR